MSATPTFRLRWASLLAPPMARASSALGKRRCWRPSVRVLGIHGCGTTLIASFRYVLDTLRCSPGDVSVIDEVASRVIKCSASQPV